MVAIRTNTVIRGIRTVYPIESGKFVKMYNRDGDLLAVTTSEILSRGCKKVVINGKELHINWKHYK